MKLRNLTLATTVILLPSPAYADSIYFCEACQPGTYGDGKSCIDCPAGKYASSVGSSSCTNCPAGKYASSTGSSSCTNCPAGKYASSVGSSSCTNCPAGKYASSTGSSSCTKCAAGTYASSAGSSSCTKCPAGKYASSTGSSSCSNCPAGQYTSSAGSSSCSNCPAGQYTSSAGSSSCSNCPAGKYASSAGSSSCTNCPAGTYSTGGASSCRSCLTIGAATCDSTTGRVTGCKAGYGYSSGTCTQCEIGTYSAGGTNACTKCDEPTINDSSNWFTYWYAKASDETINTCYSNSTTYSNKLEADDYYAQCVYDANYKKSDSVKMTLGKWKISVSRTATPECRDGCYASANAFNDQYFECVENDCESPVEQEMTCGPIYKKKTTYCTEKGSSSKTANPKTTDIEESIGGCPAGQTCLNGRCEPCPYGQYKSGTGWGKCTKKSTNIQNGGSCSRQCHFIEFHASGCCWMDLWATCGALAAAGSVMDVGTFTALSTTPVGMCLIASKNLNYWPRECSGTSSTIYGINEGKTAQTALYQCK